MEPASFDEYKKTLESLGDAQRLGDDAIYAAKKLFYVRNSINESDDRFCDEFAKG